MNFCVEELLRANDSLEQRVELRTQQLADANARLKTLDEQKTRFLGMAAHDLRSPLAVIDMAVETLSGVAGTVSEEREMLLEMIMRNCRNMRTLLNDLLDIAKIEQGKTDIRPRAVNLRDFISTIAELNRHLSKAKGIQLAFKVPDEPVEVSLDADRIEQVLNNLIGNSIKFSHGGTTIRMELSVGQTGLRFEVSDEGLGIPREEIPKLFAAFQQTSTESTAGEPGTGLGLAICRRIITRHGGTIGVESELGQGSCFWFELPGSGQATTQ